MDEKELKTIPCVVHEVIKAKYEKLIKRLSLALVFSLILNFILIVLR